MENLSKSMIRTAETYLLIVTALLQSAEDLISKGQELERAKSILVEAQFNLDHADKIKNSDKVTEMQKRIDTLLEQLK